VLFFLPQLLQACRLEFLNLGFLDSDKNKLLEKFQVLKLLLDCAKTSIDILIKIHLIVQTELKRKGSKQFDEFFNYLSEKISLIFVFDYPLFLF